jgi:penicillin-binding protein A
VETLQRVGPLLTTLCISFAVFAATVRASDIADRAKARETAGLTRGAFVDRSGAPIASTSRNGRRTYRLPGLSPLLGYRGANGTWHGLEARYNAVLAATDARTDWRSFFLHLTGRSAEGGSVHLTLDRTIQHVANAALGSASGAVVAIDPRTGGVLASVTSPSCAPSLLETRTGFHSCASNSSRPLLNRATQLAVSPGSSFKIVTLSAALDTGKYTLDTLFSGVDIFGPSPYFDNSEYPSNITRSDLTQLTLAQALAFSDNFTFAHIAVTLGAQTWLRYAHLYGLDSSIPFTVPVKASTVEHGAPTLTVPQLARSAFGAEDDLVTPLQMAEIAATVANAGVTMAPHLVSSLSNASGNTTWTFRPHPLRRVMSSRAAHEVAKGMKFVVDHGSGFNAQIKGIAVGGKTGTAASGKDTPNAWFIAFAPLKHPVVAVAVLHQFSGEGFQYAAPIARKVLVAALNEHGYHVH